MTGVLCGGMVLHWMKCLVQSHGIPEEVIDNAVKAAERYFSLPEAAKMEVSFYVSRLDCHTLFSSPSLLFLIARYP